jgi:hypothetical protein
LEGSSWKRAKLPSIGPLARLTGSRQQEGPAIAFGSHCSMPVFAGKLTSRPGSPTVEEERKNSS